MKLYDWSIDRGWHGDVGEINADKELTQDEFLVDARGIAVYLGRDSEVGAVHGYLKFAKMGAVVRVPAFPDLCEFLARFSAASPLA